MVSNKKNGPRDKSGSVPARPASRPKADQTIAESVRLYDPKIEEVLPKISSTESLPAIKAKLTEYEEEYCNIPGFNFNAFRKNLKGTGSIGIGFRKFVLLGTTRDAWILSNQNCASIYDEGMTNIDFKRMVIIKHRAKDHRMYIYRMPPSEIEKLQQASLMSGGAPQEKPKEAPAVEGEGTLVPDTSSGYFVDMEAFRRKLRAADFVKGTEEGFDLQAFADSVRFVILYDDSNKNPYYHIAAGENEDIYRMYVGVTYHDMDYFEAMFIIYHKKEHCRLYKEA